MDILQHKEGPSPALDLNDNNFESNELSDKLVNESIICHFNKSLDGTYLNNNINTKVTFDNEIKPTYTINDLSKPIKGLMCFENNNATGFGTLFNKDVGDSTQITEFFNPNGIESLNVNNNFIDNIDVKNTNLADGCRSDESWLSDDSDHHLKRDCDLLVNNDVNEFFCNHKDNLPIKINDLTTNVDYRKLSVDRDVIMNDELMDKTDKLDTCTLHNEDGTDNDNCQELFKNNNIFNNESEIIDIIDKDSILTNSNDNNINENISGNENPEHFQNIDEHTCRESITKGEKYIQSNETLAKILNKDHENVTNAPKALLDLENNIDVTTVIPKIQSFDHVETPLVPVNVINETILQEQISSQEIYRNIDSTYDNNRSTPQNIIQSPPRSNNGPKEICETEDATSDNSIISHKDISVSDAKVTYSCNYGLDIKNDDKNSYDITCCKGKSALYETPEDSSNGRYERRLEKTSDSTSISSGRHSKFLTTLQHMNEKRSSDFSVEELLHSGKSKSYSDSYKTRVHTVTFADDERPLQTINYARDRFDDSYLSGYHDQVSSYRTRISPSGYDGLTSKISPGCRTTRISPSEYTELTGRNRISPTASAGRTKTSPAGSTGRQSPGCRGSRRMAKRTTDGKENNYNTFDVYNIETAMPYIDLEAIESHLIAATKEERRRRNDREEIRKRLAKGTDTEPVEKSGRRKPNLQTRLQNGMNLQICFMNDTVSDDSESPNSEVEPKSLPSNTNTKSCHVSSSKQPQSLLCHISNNNKTNTRYTRPSTTKLTLPLKSVYTSGRVSSVADFFARQAELQSEARKALSESKETARRLMVEERETHPVSPITEIIRSSLTKVGITFPKDRRRLSRQLLTDMNVAQLQVIVNDLHTQIEYLNEKLVRYLMERDELHMTQDSMLVDIEDLTRYLSAKQKSMKSESIQNNNSAKMFSSLKPQMNRIATLVKK